MRLDNILNIIDAHSEGEPSRIVIGGMGDVPGDTMFEKRLHIMAERDHLRRLLLFEPRGIVSLSADIVFPSKHPDADFGYVIIESTDYPPMSGTNTINTATVLLETGMLKMVEGLNTFNLESPDGLIEIRAQCHDGKCESVTFQNQPSFVTHLDATIDVPELGKITVDAAYGGAFFVFADAAALGYSIEAAEARELSHIGQEIKKAAAEQLTVSHPNPQVPNTVTCMTFVAPPLAGGDGRNVNIVNPGRVDRSACGTGTCARMAILHARGELAVGEDFVHESILSSRFVGRILGTTELGDRAAILPTISGRAWIYATSQLGQHPSDPFALGYEISDTWGSHMAEWRDAPVAIVH